MYMILDKEDNQNYYFIDTPNGKFQPVDYFR